MGPAHSNQITKTGILPARCFFTRKDVLSPGSAMPGGSVRVLKAKPAFVYTVQDVRGCTGLPGDKLSVSPHAGEKLPAQGLGPAKPAAANLLAASPRSPESM